MERHGTFIAANVANNLTPTTVGALTAGGQAMIKINIEKVLVGLGTLIFYMGFPFYWWLMLDKIPQNKGDQKGKEGKL